MLIIGVTGTPGSGKSDFAQKLASAAGFELLEVNDLVEKYDLYTGLDETGAKIVKMNELSLAIKSETEKASKLKKTSIIVVGHLLSDLNLTLDMAVVTRVGLHELINRLEKRGYGKEKIRENIVSEAIDYCGASIKDIANETYEVEEDSEKNMVISYISNVVNGRKVPPPDLKNISKMSELLELVYEGNKYNF